MSIRKDMILVSIFALAGSAAMAGQNTAVKAPANTSSVGVTQASAETVVLNNMPDAQIQSANLVTEGAKPHYLISVKQHGQSQKVSVDATTGNILH